MLGTAALLFALGAVVGLVMASMHVKGRSIPMAAALLHGLFGASGLVLLAYVVLGGEAEAGYSGVALGLFVVAALGGVVLFANHLRGRRFPTGLMVLHALVAAVALVFLLVSL